MLKPVRSAARLARAARVLAHHDALVPPQMAATLPLSVRLGHRLLKGGARPAPMPAGAPAGRVHGERLAEALQDLGPSYIKMGQLMATRPDLVGADVAEGLGALKDRLPPFSQDEALAVIETELGGPVGRHFASFGPPVAAASIAQVHRAEVIGADGERHDVAVKILRPGIEAAFRKDLDAFFLLARGLEWARPALKRLRPVDVVATLATSVGQEMDLRLEGAAASELGDAMGESEDFRVPRIDWERTGARILTSEWVEGVALSDRAAVNAAGYDPKRLARLVIQSFLRQALFHGFFHADMHEGNLFVDAEGRLVAVDFGIMGRLDRATRRYTAEILYGFILRDYRRIARQHFDAGYVPAGKSLDDFALALRAVGEKVWGRPADEISMARLLAQLFEVTERFDMALQPSLLLLQKTMVVVEGVARSLDPEHSIWESARPVLEEWMTAEMGPEARLREVAGGALSLTRAVQELPQLMEIAERAGAALGPEGLKLHPDTAHLIGQSESRANRSLTLAAWLAAGALLVLAFTQIL